MKRMTAQDIHINSQIKFLKKKQQNVCFYCKKLLKKDCTKDHYIPLSNGGKNEIENIVLACQKCNCGKANSMPLMSIKDAWNTSLKSNDILRDWE